MDKTFAMKKFIKILCVGLLATMAGAAPALAQTIAFVQRTSGTPQSSPTSVAVAFTSAQAAGNLNIVAVGWNNATSTVTAVTDTRGNTYRLAIGPTTGTGMR